MKSFAAKIILIALFFLPVSIASAQSFNQTPVNMNGLSSILLSCQKYGGKSSNEWITEGVGRIGAFTNKAVTGATRGIFGGTKTYSLEGQDVSYAVGGLFCGEKCKGKINEKIAKESERKLGEKAAGSLIQKFSSSPITIWKPLKIN